MAPKAKRPLDIDGGSTVDPAGEVAGIAGRGRQVVATRQHGYASARRRRAIEHDISQPPTGVARHDDVAGEDFHMVHLAFNKFHATSQSWPRLDERGVQLCARGRQRLIRNERFGRRIVEKHHGLRQQAMAAGKIHHTASTTQPPHSPRDLPRFVELFARKTSRVTHHACEPVEQCVGGKAAEVAVRQPRA